MGRSAIKYQKRKNIQKRGFCNKYKKALILKNAMKKIFLKHKEIWIQKSFLINVGGSFLFLIIASFINQYANLYTAKHISNAVTDLLLDNLPVMDVHLIFSEGAILFLFLLICILFYEPKYIPFVLKSLAIFTIIRSFFMILTHLAPPVDQIFINPTDYIQRISSGYDLFFSGHTGIPFLLACIYKNRKYLYSFFLFCTMIGGGSVILGHLHYSIDVFSALFISFGIFHISKIFFPKDYDRIGY